VEAIQQAHHACCCDRFFRCGLIAQEGGQRAGEKVQMPILQSSIQSKRTSKQT